MQLDDDVRSFYPWIF